VSSRYQVTIKQITTDIPAVKEEYQELYSDATWERMTAEEQEKAGGRQNGYVPHETTKTEELVVFEQTVQELNIQDVVAVINGIKEAK
jgi:hypothetical protein